MDLVTTPSGRAIKFTPERLNQIKNLIERGKTREEIAEIVGSTVGSLSVTCSRLGIPLRRLQPAGDGPSPGKTQPSQAREEAIDPRPPAPVKLLIEHLGRKSEVDLPLSLDQVGQLLIEAELRGVRFKDLVANALKEIIER